MIPCIQQHILAATVAAIVIAAPARAQDASPLTQAVPQSSGRLTPQELAIWNDPTFKTQFIQSYMAETEIEPRVTVDERKKILKVLDLISSDKLDEAAQLLEKQIGDVSEAELYDPVKAAARLLDDRRSGTLSAVFDFTLANIYFQQEQFDRATVAYLVAVKKFPKFRRAWRNLALIYVRQSKFEEAVPALTRVIELGGADALTYGLLGYASSSLENYISAESSYRSAILLDAATMDWKMGLARCLFKQERYADAAALCGQLIAASPERADLWLLQANAYIGLNQPMRAAENYELVDRMGKSTAESLYTLADIYVNAELYELAVSSYIRAIKVNPQNKPDRTLRAAKVLTARGASDEATLLIDSIGEAYKDRLSVNEQKDLLKLRARLAVSEGAGDEEARVLEEIVRLDPLDGEALILLGQYYRRAEQYEKAALLFERAEGIEKYEADAKVRHAQLLVAQGKYAEALPLLRRAQQVDARENVQRYLEQVERISKGR